MKNKDVTLASKMYKNQVNLYSSHPNVFLQQSRMKLRKMVLKFLGNVNGNQILDAGCGNGNYARLLEKAGAKVIGIDVTEEFLRIARKQCKKCQFVNMDFERTTFKNDYFDAIIAIYSIVHKKDLLSVFREFHRVLKHGGKIIVVVPHPVRRMLAYRSDFNYFLSGFRLEKRYGIKLFNYHRSLEEYIDTITKSGFIIEKIVEPRPPKTSLRAIKKCKVIKEDNYPHSLIIKFGKK